MKINRFNVEYYYNKYCCEDQIKDVEDENGYYCKASDMLSLQERFKKVNDLLKAVVEENRHENDGWLSCTCLEADGYLEEIK